MFKKTILLVAFFTITSGCFPTVGDDCETSAECPAGAICDVTAPEGYCMVQDCETNQCHATSVCIEFDKEESFCLKSCESDTDCRDAYECKSDPHGIRYCYTK